MGKNHRPSKRLSCKKKYKIIKKIAKHNKKLRKEQHSARKMRLVKKLNKNLGVPNSFPFKDEILMAAAVKKLEEKDLQQKRMEEKKLEKEAIAKKIAEEGNSISTTANKINVLKKSEIDIMKSTFRRLKRVIEEADVVLEVLDARDPLGCRCPQLESMVMNSGKLLVLVLNKIDLIPRKNLLEWLAYLRNELPTIAFKAAIPKKQQPKKKKRGFVTKDPAIEIYERFMEAKECIGATTLMKALKKCSMNTKIKIGVVGFPNVGKRSVINYLEQSFVLPNLNVKQELKGLKRSHTHSVGINLHDKRTFKEIELNDKINLLACPGIVFASADSPKTAWRNVVLYKKRKHYIEPAAAIVKRLNMLQLSMHFCIPEVSSLADLLPYVIARMPTLKMDEQPSNDMAAFKFIDEWNKGTIKYYTHPPAEYQKSAHLSEDYVTEMKKKIDVSALRDELDNVPLLFPSDAIEATQEGTTDMMEMEETDDSSSEEESDPAMGEPESEDDVYASKKLSVDFEMRRRIIAEGSIRQDALRKKQRRKRKKKSTFKI